MSDNVDNLPTLQRLFLYYVREYVSERISSIYESSGTIEEYKKKVIKLFTDVESDYDCDFFMDYNGDLIFGSSDFRENYSTK